MSDVLAHSEASIRNGSKSFAAAARLFSPPVRESVVMLYAWCRHLDDVVDGQEGGFASAGGQGTPGARLTHLEQETWRVFRGDPVDDPVFRAFAEVVRRHDIPESEAEDHLTGFAMDVAGQAYESFGDTLTYCYHVAGVVGLMMARVMGVTEPRTLDRACDLGIAFQLTNIARDIVDDAKAGRVYLPLEWLAAENIAWRDLTDRAVRPQLARLARRLVTEAEPYYRSAAVGVRALPFRSAWAIATALGVYRQIGVEVADRGSHAWDRRVSTGRLAKLRHAGVGAVRALKLPLRPRASREGLFARPLD